MQGATFTSWLRKGHRVLTLGCVLAALAAFTPVALASPSKPAQAPQVMECTTWITVQTRNVSHTYGVVTYTGYVRLQKLVAFPNDFTYCGAARATAELSTPTGALSASVQGSLYYQPYGTTSRYTVYGPFLTASSGQAQYSWAPNTSGQSAQCAEALGDYWWPDGSNTYATAFYCF